MSAQALLSKKNHSILLANISLVIATIIWGSTFFIIRDSLSHINAIVLTGERFIISAILLGSFLLFLKKNIFAHFKDGVLMGIALAAFYLPQTIGLNYTTASNSGFITSLLVLFVCLFNFVFYKKIPSRGQMFAMLLAILGLGLIESFTGNFNAGDLLTLVSAGFGGLQIVFIDAVMRKGRDPWILNFQQFLIAGIISIVIAFIFRLPFTITNVSAVYSMIYLAIFGGIVAYGLLFMAQRHLSALNTGILLMLEPIFAGIFAWTMGHEAFQAQQALGGFLIVIAALIASVYSVKSPLEKTMNSL